MLPPLGYAHVPDNWGVGVVIIDNRARCVFSKKKEKTQPPINLMLKKGGGEKLFWGGGGGGVGITADPGENSYDPPP